MRYVHLLWIGIAALPACQQVLGIEPGELVEEGGGGFGGARGTGGDPVGNVTGVGGATEGVAVSGTGPTSGVGAGGGSYVAFVSETVWTLPSSVTEADTDCNDDAINAGIGGEFKAWLSTTTEPAIDRLPGGIAWTLPDGSPVVSDKSELVGTPTLSNPINKTAASATPTTPTPAKVFTGTLASGLLAEQNNCANWVSTTAGTLVGDINGTDATWTQDAFDSCSATALVYCFQVAP